MNKGKSNGITLISLVITIIVLIIISGISIVGTIRGRDETEESTQFYELSLIQHAILEQYTKTQLTKEELPGTTIELSEVQSIIEDINLKTGENIELKGKNTDYKELDQTDLEKLGITEEEYTFIVNYSTGEVINKTLKVTKSGRALYIFSRSEE